MELQDILRVTKDRAEWRKIIQSCQPSDRGRLKTKQYCSVADVDQTVELSQRVHYVWQLFAIFGSRALSFKRPLLSLSVDVYMCVCGCVCGYVRNFEVKYLGNERR